MSLFVPKMYQKDIFKINYNKLKELSYKIIIFDLDNTLGGVKEEICSKEVINFLKELQKDFIVYIASNSRYKRVSKFCSNLNCKFVSFSLKPTKKGISKIKKQEKIDYNEMTIIGDQILTDIFVGNRVNMFTILIDPLKQDLKITGLNRKIENILNKKNNIIRGNYYEKK